MLFIPLATAILGFEITHLAKAEPSVNSVPGGLNQQTMEDFNRCIQLINKAEVSRLKQQSILLNQQVRALCGNQQRNKAQNAALGFAMHLQKSKDVSKYRFCTRKLLPSAQTDVDSMLQFSVSSLRFKHICELQFEANQ